MDPVAAVAEALAQLRSASDRRTLVDAVGEAPEHGGEVTVSLVAERLGLDVSRASRLVAAAVDEGLVHRRSSRRDARRAHLELTEQGRQMWADVVAFRQEEAAERMAEWSAADRGAFAELLGRFAAADLTPFSARRRERGDT